MATTKLWKTFTNLIAEKLLTIKGWLVVESTAYVALRGTVFTRMPAPQTSAGTATLTSAQMLGGILVATPAGTATYTTLTGTLLKAAMPNGFLPNDSFDLTIINLGTTTQDITLAGGSDVTIVGEAILRPGADAATEHGGQGTWRFRNSTGVTWIAYRIA